MKGFSSGDGGVRVDLLERFREGVEQGPCCAGAELLVLRFPPMGQNLRDLAGRDGTAIRRLDHEVMCAAVGEAHVLVGFNALVQLHEVGAELTDGTSCELPEIPDGKSRVLPADLDEARKREIVTNIDLRPGYEASREGLVV